MSGRVFHSYRTRVGPANNIFQAPKGRDSVWLGKCLLWSLKGQRFASCLLETKGSLIFCMVAFCFLLCLPQTKAWGQLRRLRGQSCWSLPCSGRLQPFAQRERSPLPLSHYLSSRTCLLKRTMLGGQSLFPVLPLMGMATLIMLLDLLELVWLLCRMGIIQHISQDCRRCHSCPGALVWILTWSFFQLSYPVQVTWRLCALVSTC